MTPVASPVPTRSAVHMASSSPAKSRMRAAFKVSTLAASSPFSKEADAHAEGGDRDEWLRSDVGRAVLTGDLERVRILITNAANKAADLASQADDDDGGGDSDDDDDEGDPRRSPSPKKGRKSPKKKKKNVEEEVNVEVSPDMLEKSLTDPERKKLQRMRPADRRRWRRRRCAELFAAAPDAYGEAPLHIAAVYGHERIAKYLVESLSAPVDVPNAEGLTPFLLACARGSLELASYLFRNGASDGPNPQQEHTCARHSFSGATALHLAATSGNSKLVQWLMSPAGGSLNPNWRDDFLRLPVESAATADVVEVIEAAMRDLARAEAEKQAATL